MFSYDNAADTFFRFTQEESWGVFAARHAQAVAGNSAGATRIDLAVNGEWLQSLPAAIDGAWSGEVWLQPGLWSSIEAQAFHLSGQKAATDTRHVKMSPENREDSRTTQYEPNEGWVTSRHSDTGTQTLHWDARDRLWKVHQRDALGNGYDWEAFYDGFGRRLRTATTPVTQHSPDPAAATTIDSRYDPMVEFLEIALSIDSPHGQFRYWKVHGPDLNGHYGGRQGIGGLDAWVTQSDGTFSEILSDRFGHVLAYLDATNFPQWNNTPLAGYGPLPGYPIEHPGHPLDANNPPLHHAIHPHLWRGYRLDPTGLIHMGARYYDPQTGRFLSTDPLGHAASMDLYSYANGDPVNWIDPTGRGGEHATADSAGDPIGRLTWEQALEKAWEQLEKGEISTLEYNVLKEEITSVYQNGGELLQRGWLKDSVSHVDQSRPGNPYFISYFAYGVIPVGDTIRIVNYFNTNDSLSTYNIPSYEKMINSLNGRFSVKSSEGGIYQLVFAPVFKPWNEWVPLIKSEAVERWQIDSIAASSIQVRSGAENWNQIHATVEEYLHNLGAVDTYREGPYYSGFFDSTGMSFLDASRNLSTDTKPTDLWHVQMAINRFSPGFNGVIIENIPTKNPDE